MRIPKNWGDFATAHSAARPHVHSTRARPWRGANCETRIVKVGSVHSKRETRIVKVGSVHSKRETRGDEA
eukprot:1194912-Prorocentrum_minimum.AAC.1